MRLYLDEYMRTLSGRRQMRVGHLLEEARVDKVQLDGLAEKLDASADSVSLLNLRRDRVDSIIQPNITASNVRDILENVREMYDVSNTVATLLSSHASVLTSDIQAIEDEIVAMEKMAFNFGFLLDDNQAYDYALLEAFTDERGRDPKITSIPDRSGLEFGPAEMATIKSDEGVLTLPEMNSNISHGLVGRIVEGNATAFVIDQTNLTGMFQSGTSTGWRMTVAAAGPVASPLAGAGGRGGAQVLLEFTLTHPSPCSEIRLTPYADMPLEVLSVKAYASDGDSGEELLQGVTRLEHTRSIHFPVKSIHRFEVLLNQPTYHRVTMKEEVVEYQYHQLIREVNNNRTARTYDIAKIEHLVQGTVSSTRTSRNKQVISIPNTDLVASRGPMKPVTLALDPNQTIWNIDGQTGVFEQVLISQGGDLNSIQRNGEMSLLTHALSGEDVIHQVVLRKPQMQITGFNYYYTIGLHNVKVGISSPGFKGAFVSRPLPSPGDVGEVRVKVSEENYIKEFTDRHQKRLTSVEYSVSNSSSPDSERDWIPILPVGGTSVEGERLFLDEFNKGFLRFPALIASPISVYRNGYNVGLDSSSFVLGDPGSVIGVKINSREANPDDIFTVDYTPTGDPTVVDFQPYGFDSPPLVFSHDVTGSGEGFLSTGERNTVTLSHHPYIDAEQAMRNRNYAPISIQTESGRVIENLTDYRSRKTVPLPPDGYYYIHSGDSLMFNRPIKEPFRVYYQYLQNNVRMRAVLRCNVKDFVSPKVDYVHMKAKTRRPDVGQL